jgi:tetratricopeptide (TPR) repeat protein
VDAGIDAAPASPEAVAARETLSAALNAARFSEALALGADAVAKHGEDGWLRYLYGSALRLVLDYDAAGQQLSKALELRPRDVHILVENAHLAMALDKLDEASAHLAKAHSVDPTATELLEARADLNALRGLKRGRRTTHQQDSEEFYLDIIINGIENGKLDETLSSRLHKKMNHDGKLAAGLTAFWKRIASSPAADFLGWDVSRRTRRGAVSGAPVSVRFMWRINSAEPVLTDVDAKISAMLPGGSAAVLAGLEGDDRKAFLARLAKVRPVEISSLRIKMLRNASHWAIADVLPPGSDESSLATLLAVTESAESPGKTRNLYRIGGMVAIVLLAVGILVWLSRRRDADDADA